MKIIFKKTNIFRKDTNNEKYEFPKAVGTNSVTHILRTILEGAMGVKRDMRLWFTEFIKAFGNLKHEEMSNY